jgi:hypothetical protein
MALPSIEDQGRITLNDLAERSFKETSIPLNGPSGDTHNHANRDDTFTVTTRLRGGFEDHLRVNADGELISRTDWKHPWDAILQRMLK